MHGSGWAVEDVFTLLGRPLLRYLQGSGVEDPEDVLGDVLYRVARKLDRFTGTQVELRRWVFTIARNLATDRLRQQVRRRRARPAAPARSGESDPFDPRLAAALATLTDEQREVVVLRFVVDLSLDDVATLTHRSVGAVKAMQHRALSHLAALLDIPAGAPDS